MPVRVLRALPPPLAPAVPGSFAHLTLRERMPRILGEVLERNRLPAAAAARLRRARGRLPELAVRPLDLPAEDAPLWDGFFRAHAGRRLAELPFYELEAYFYAWLLVETRWFETGRDPFSAAKRDEFAGSAAALEEASRAVLRDAELAPREAARRALLRAVLGNHADSSHPQALRAGAGTLRLVQRAPWRSAGRLLLGGGRVRILADNAMSELWYDLVLAWALARASPATTVEVVVKRHPMFVSDAVAGDVDGLWELAEGAAGAPCLRRVSRRVREAVGAGRIVVSAWPALNAPLHFSAPELAPLLAANPLLVKGDANYRRALEDRDWPPGTPLDRACRAPLSGALFLRVMKSECVAGLPAPLVRRLEHADPQWRTDGRFAVVQLLSRRRRDASSSLPSSPTRRPRPARRAGSAPSR